MITTVCNEQESEPAASIKPAREADSGLEELTLSLKKQSKSGKPAWVR